MLATQVEDALDVAEADPQTALMLLSSAVHGMLHYAYLNRGKFIPRDKELLENLRSHDPRLAELTNRFYASPAQNERIEAAQSIADVVLGTRGFFEWESILRWVEELLPGSTAVVIKRNVRGEPTWRYEGRLLERSEGRYVVEAYFDKEDAVVGGMPIAFGDRFVETYYTDRWYNILEIRDREDGSLRGWYCNITCPAVVGGNSISYVDLALDLLVFPDGRMVVLDEDEFESLQISQDTRIKAREALQDLMANFPLKAP
jgi:hypothetical protein